MALIFVSASQLAAKIQRLETRSRAVRSIASIRAWLLTTKLPAFFFILTHHNLMSKLRQIALLGAPVLRLQAEAVDDINSPETLDLISDMQATLADSGGVGLAAPQIYESRRIVIIASRPNARYPYAPQMSPTIMLNPTFQPSSQDMEKDWEGCLSIPGIRALVSRYQHITISYTDTTGKSCQLNVDGFVARVFQHEYDHLNGLVFLDRVENNQDIVSEQEFLKLIANR